MTKSLFTGVILLLCAVSCDRATDDEVVSTSSTSALSEMVQNQNHLQTNSASIQWHNYPAWTIYPWQSSVRHYSVKNGRKVHVVLANGGSHSPRLYVNQVELLHVGPYETVSTEFIADTDDIEVYVNKFPADVMSVGVMYQTN